jgi:serine/threonine protein kinase
VFAGTYKPVEPDGREKETRVAVKCVEMPAAHTEFFNGLMQELTIQMKLEECPYVCKCYGYYTDNHRVCIVMEFLEKDLEKDVLERTPGMRKYTEMELLEYLREVVFALQYAKRKVELCRKSHIETLSRRIYS